MTVDPMGRAASGLRGRESWFAARDGLDHHLAGGLRAVSLFAGPVRLCPVVPAVFFRLPSDRDPKDLEGP